MNGIPPLLGRVQYTGELVGKTGRKERRIRRGRKYAYFVSLCACVYSRFLYHATRPCLVIVTKHFFAAIP